MTADRTNRKELIIEISTDLFLKQGYSATSIREIAAEADCTEAAIYYHFKDGKRALLEAVVRRNTPHLDHVIDALREVDNLPEFIRVYQQEMEAEGVEHMVAARWFLAEIHLLTPDERQLIQSKWISLQTQLAEQLCRIMPDEEQANRFAWLLVVAGFGYGMLFYNYELSTMIDFPASELVRSFLEVMAQ